MDVRWLFVVLGYLIGAVPFAYIVAKWLSRQDIRDVGSRNVGATNVYRVLGWKWAALVFALDAAKGAVFVLLVSWLYPSIVYIPAAPQFILLAPVIGHCFPVFLKFRGGRGVATSAGVAAVMSPLGLFAAVAAYAAALALTRKSFAGSLCALAVFLAFDLWLFQRFWPPVVIVLALLLILNHRTHIMKLFGARAD